MSDTFLKPKLPFVTKAKKHHIEITLIKPAELKEALASLTDAQSAQAGNAGFEASPQELCVLYSADGQIDKIIAGRADDIDHELGASLAQKIKTALSKDTLNQSSFGLTNDLHADDAYNIALGWGLAAYKFDAYKSDDKKSKVVEPKLVWPDNIHAPKIEAQLRAISMLRDLINTPANDMGPDDIEQLCKSLAKSHKARTKIIKDKDLLKENFPLIYTVGQASPRRPRLIEMRWGKSADPKVTIIGKGVVFDTGGLNLKPTQYMALMKKDMGGAAHALSLASLIMDNKLPVNLRLLIPAVENAVAGEAFRPGDVIKSRKGIFVENTNTDAEGRLILADTLTYACEESPELIIDFATLTGSARAALGPDIPAMFSTDEKTGKDLQALSFDINDPLWVMPLWDKYKKHIESSTGDILNSASLPGDLIYSALFLKSFLSDSTDINWVHIDCFAWESAGKPGRPKGAADTGLRACFAYLEKRFAKAA